MASKEDDTVAKMPPSLLPLLASFVSVVEAGSFTGAARRLGTDKTLLSRRVAALEEALKSRLLNRTTRSIHITQAGRRLFQAAAGPLAELLRALDENVEGDVLRGRVRVATLENLGAELWGPVVARLRKTAPELFLEVRASDGMISLVSEGFDFALRSGNLPDSSLVARRLTQWRYVLVATPAWVALHPQVTHPEHLSGHWLLYAPVAEAARWAFTAGRERCEIDMRALVETNSSAVMLAAVREGVGVCAMAPFVVAGELGQGTLVRLLPRWRVDHVHSMFAVTPHRAYLPRRVEVVIDAVAAQLTARAPSWNRWSD